MIFSCQLPFSHSLKVTVSLTPCSLPCGGGVNDRLSAVQYSSLWCLSVVSAVRVRCRNLFFFPSSYYCRLLCKRSRFMFVPHLPQWTKGKCWFCVLNECYQREAETRTRTIHLPNSAAGMTHSVLEGVFYQAAGGEQTQTSWSAALTLYESAT